VCGECHALTPGSPFPVGPTAAQAQGHAVLLNSTMDRSSLGLAPAVGTTGKGEPRRHRVTLAAHSYRLARQRQCWVSRLRSRCGRPAGPRCDWRRRKAG